jgi:cysteine desulfuration protein SufE
MMSIPPPLASLLDEFESLEDLSMRTELLIEYGEQFKEVPESIAERPFPESHKIPACESDAYLFYTKNPDATLNFYFAVENPQGISAKALASILQETLSGAPLQQVSEINEDIAYRIFGRELSMGKGLGLSSMIREVRRIALRNYQTP